MGKQPKRRNWRKAKIEDVEEALEDERLVNKLKRKAAADKGTSEAPELFTVDTAGSCEGLSSASKRAIARAKIFPPKGPNLGLSASEEAKVARAEGALGGPRKLRRRASAREADVFDLWAAPAQEAAKAATEREQAAASTVRRVAQNAPSSAPKTLHQKVSAAPAVLPAHEGQSMNPHGVAYEELACLAAAKELEREREVEAMDRQMRPLTHELRDALGAEATRDMDEEAKVQAYRELACPTAAAGAARAEAEAEEALRKGQPWMKSQAHRNKEQKRKRIEAKQAQAKAQKRLEKSVGDVGAILKEMKDREEWLEGRKEYKRSMRAKRKQLEETEGVVPKCRRIGRGKFAEEAMVVPDAEASAKGLRAMPLQGASAVRERISSIVRRGMLPAPVEASRGEVIRHKKNAGKLRRGRKFVSP
eukprot:CAMPEP_0198527572 /NCGR_PEP_ID=MMETSP1462-20131121/24625_1 /TAXON_ID=1333877 /ORGANISM="Brandtodinium nutriculum, Strain RCC3387" /LENGTH=419 /DNA_ID=CAMNT_0044257381 /DNA_START=44 /DNA_END=1300 /DNA_ORIENTATION=+